MASGESAADGVPYLDAGILLVEPDDRARGQAERTLAAAGYWNVTSLADPSKIDAALGATAPDIVLIAANIGEGDGFAWAETQREHPQSRRPSVIFMTRDGDADSRAGILDRGGDDYVALPLDPVDVVARLRAHATLRLLARAAAEEKDRLESLLSRRTHRLNDALDLLRETERSLRRELDAARTENRDRIDYFAETHHELRTPLNAICGMSDAMQLETFGALGNAKYKEYAGNIYQAGQHLLGIIDSRLELSRIEAGAEELEIEPVEVTAVLQETVDMLGGMAEKANIALNVDIEPNLPVIQSDKRKIRQVMVNMVSNAIKFTPGNGRVTLKAKRNRKKGVLVLVVSDTGIGMTPEDLHGLVREQPEGGDQQRDGEENEDEGGPPHGAPRQ
ncbi:MAG: ATP-binding protein [Alphaproteobacteria bacterium]|nr:ATP-binding protein [Alphaproteobacteria bacterium]